MYELKITATTVEELLTKAAALAALGVTVSVMAPEVPLPEPRFSEPVSEPTPPKRRGRPPKVTEPDEPTHEGQADEPADPQSAAPVESAAETPASSPSPEPSDTSPTIPSKPTTTAADGGATSASRSDGLAISDTRAIVAEHVNKTAEIEHVAPDVSEKAPEPNTSHAAPGEIYLLAGDKPNDQGRQITYIDGVRHSSVMNPETSKLKTYAAHAPEAVEQIVITSESQYEVAQAEYEAFFGNEPAAGTPEAARFVGLGEALAAYEGARPAAVAFVQSTLDAIVAPMVEQLEQLVEGVEPLKEGDAVPEEVTVPLTEKDQEALAELERDEALAQQRDGSQAGETRELDEPADDFPPPFAQFIEKVEEAGAFQEVKLAMRDFFGSDFWKGLTPERQNRVRANVEQTCIENHAAGRMPDLPDQIDDVTRYRLWIECQKDVDAIRGTRDVLARSDQWSAAPDALKMAIDNAVEARVAVLEGE